MVNIEEYIIYRVQKADEAFEEALILAEKERWSTVINRLYYSCFYAVIALLLRNNINTNTHQGALGQFGLHFIKTGKIDGEYGKMYSKLFDFRQRGDYGDMFDFTERDVSPLIEKVPKFLKEIKNHIKNNER